MPNLSSFGRMTDDHQYHIRDIALLDMLKDWSFVDAMLFTWTGRRLTESERGLVERCLVACIDHGEEVPSAHVARVVASCGKPLADAVSAGLLTIGPRHGNAGGAASELLREAVKHENDLPAFLEEMLKASPRLSGFGHAVYEIDPRAEELARQAKTILSSTVHLDVARKISTWLSEKKQKPLPLNIDGALGAIVADMGLPPEVADALFLISRSVGIVAHAQEEARQSRSYRRGA